MTPDRILVAEEALSLYQLRDELISLHQQLNEVQSRIADLQLDTAPESYWRDDKVSDAGQDANAADRPEITLAELQQRLAQRMRNLDAELSEDDQ